MLKINKIFRLTGAKLWLFSSFMIIYLILSLRIASTINSYFSYFLVLATVILLGLFINIFSEFQTTFPDKGLYDYLKHSFNRYIAFTFTLFYYILTLLFLVELVKNFIKPGFFVYIGILAYLLLLSLVYIFNSQDLNYLIIILSIVFVVLLFTGILVLSFLNFKISLPAFAAFGTNSINLVYLIFLLFAFVILNFSSITRFFLDAEEYVIDINKFLKRMTLFIALIIFLTYPLFSRLGLSFDTLIRFLPIRSFLLISALKLATVLIFFYFVYYSLPFYLTTLVKEGLFFKSFQDRHEAKTSIFTFIIFSVLSALSYYNKILFNIDFYFFFLVFLLGLIVLGVTLFRKKDPNRERPYAIKHWKFPVFYSIIIFSVLFVILKSNLAFIFYMGLIFFVAFVVYVLFEIYYNEESSELFGDFLAPLSDIASDVFLPQNLRNKLLKKLGDIKGNIILNYGCSTGALALPLLERIGVKGKLYATSKSAKQLKILEGKVAEKGFFNLGYKIVLLKDFYSSVNPSIKHIDKFISAGSLASIRDIDTFLKELNLIMDVSGKLVVLEYNKFLHFIPNKWINSDSKIKDLFDRNGFGVVINRKRRLLWETVIIEGIKFKNAYYLDTWYVKKDFQ